MELKRGKWRLKWSLREKDEWFCQEKIKEKLKMKVEKSKGD